MASGGCFPLLNDIATDLDNAPVFIQQPPEKPTYNAARNRPLQEANYPDLRNLAASWPPDDAFARVLAIVRRRSWAIAGLDERGRRVQAVSLTPVLRFRDDVVIEVRTAPPGSDADIHSIVAMRSKSRVGRRDFGANAKRIRAFFRDLRAAP